MFCSVPRTASVSPVTQSDGRQSTALSIGRTFGALALQGRRPDLHRQDRPRLRQVSAADLQKRLKPLIRRTQPYAKRIAHKGIWVETFWRRSSTERNLPRVFAWCEALRRTPGRAPSSAALLATWLPRQARRCGGLCGRSSRSQQARPQQLERASPVRAEVADRTTPLSPPTWHERAMKIRSHSESHIVELDDGSRWRIFPGDLDLPLD